MNVSLRSLRKELERAGCFDRRPVGAFVALAANLLASFGLFFAASQGGWASPALFLLGSLVFFRLGWLMHDGAHGSVFGVAPRDRAFTRLVCAFLGGVPSGWAWGHNRHHQAPNVRGVDGDQKERWDEASRGISWGAAALRIFVLRRVGGWLLPRSILMLWIRDGVYSRRSGSPRFVGDVVAAVTAQVLQLAGFFGLFGVWALPLYLLHTHIGLVYLNAVFLGSHYDLPSFDAPEHRSLSHGELQVLTARNYPGGIWHRWFCGGLEHQIEHHLFPDLPRHGLLKARPFVRAWCEKNGLSYTEKGLLESWGCAVRFHTVGGAR